MGRYDFRAIRVRQAAKQLVDNRKTSQLPGWYSIVGDIPPSEILTRPIMRIPRTKGNRKPSKMFNPVEMRFPEDKLRSDFFGDHPWELARPKIILEDNGNDSKGWDWSKIVQQGKKLDGESVVQRQMWLMEHAHYSKEKAYDTARREFYRHRHLEDIQRRIAKEEAMATGAYFGKGALEVGMQLEDQAFEDWKEWASKNIQENENVRAQMYSGPARESENLELDDEEVDQALLEFDDSVPPPSDGERALGGAPMHP